MGTADVAAIAITPAECAAAAPSHSATSTSTGPPPREPTERFGRVLGREEDGRPLLDTEERGEDENDAAAAAATPSDGTSEFAAALRLAMLNKRHSRGLLES